MRLIAQFITLTTLAIVLTACSTNSNSDECSAPDCLVYGLTLNVSGIDPHVNRSTELGIVLRNVYDTLIYRHPDTNAFVAGLAQSWEISDDGLVYDFSLRNDVIFHDGTPFNADAVAANFARIFDDNVASQRSRFLLGPVSSYQVVDEFTFRVTMSEPFTPLLDSLSQVYLGIASPTALAEFQDDQLRYQFHQVGTGPFEFVEYLPEDRIVIRRNPNYTWGPDFYDEIGTVEEIEFRFFRDAATRLIALENGDAQIMGELLPTDARSLANNQNISLFPVSIPGQPLQFYFNTQQAPTDNLAVRQALIYAINRAAVVDAVYGGFSPVAWGPVSSTTQFYNRGVVNVYSYNLDQARNLLADAGYTDTDGDAILDRDGEPLAIKLIQPPWGFVPEVVQFLQDQWRSLGIQVEIEQVPGYAALLEATTEQDYNLVSFDQPGLDPYILSQAYLSASADNWALYENTELDSILIQASQENDVEERRLLYGRAQAIIMEQAIILPVRDYTNLNAATANVSGLTYDAYGWFPLLYGVSIEAN
ncbi:MAG: ABC transporter substrate-binding protein [Phototrophicaceae bacterium]